MGAGAIHAAAIGVHSEHRQAVYAFTATAIFQLAWGAIALVRSSRVLGLVGAAGNAAIIGGWVLAKTTGIRFVDGLTEAEGVQLADGLAAALAALAVAAALLGLSARTPSRLSSGRLALTSGVAALAVAVLAVPGMASAGSHAHSGSGHDDGHATAASDHHDDGEAHGTVASPTATAGSADHGHAPSASQPAGTAAAPGVLHEHGPTIVVTAAELEGAARLVAETKAGVARLHDFEAAKAEGYYEVAPPRNKLVHYLHGGYNRDGRVLDPEKPESLIYLQLPGGTWRLVGAMYRMPSADQPGPRVGGPLTAWHAHDNLCTAGGRVVATTTNGICARGTLTKTPEMLHVWLVDNPDGVFSDDMEPAALGDLSKPS